MRQRRPRPYSMELPPASEFVRFSGSSNHLIHAFLAVASLGNLCPPKLLNLGTQHSVPRLFLLRLSMPPTATHQQDNFYGGSAIWRVSKAVSTPVPVANRTLAYWALESGLHAHELKIDRPRTVRAQLN